MVSSYCLLGESWTLAILLSHLRNLRNLRIEPKFFGYMRILLVLCLLLAAALPAQAQRNLTVEKSAPAERRVALVIGNGAYASAPLKNPPNDARDMAGALRRLGFTVIEKINVPQKEMNRAIAEFGEKLNASTMALFF